MSKYYLVRYADDWSDEMDIDGHVVLNENRYIDFEIALDHMNYLWFSVGTNQEIEYESNEQIREVVEVNEISEQDFQTLNRLDLLSTGFADSFVNQLIEDCSYSED